MNKKVDNVNLDIGETIGLAIFKRLLNQRLISENEYKNMTKEFSKLMKKPRQI